MQTIILSIEKLKKEIWAINKKKIPALQEQISCAGGVDTSEIYALLEEHQFKLNNLSSSLTSLETKIQTNTNGITSLNNKVSENEGEISSIREEISQLQTSLSSLNSSLNELSLEVKSNATSITQNYNQISSCKDKLNTLEEDLSQTTQTSNDALALAQEVKNQVEGLGNGGSSSASQSVLIFDMRDSDENINLGYTSGLHKGDKLTLTLSEYRFLKVYATFSGSYESQIIIDLANKKGYYFTLPMWRGNYLEFIRIRIPTNLKTFIFDSYVQISFESSPPSFTIADADTKASFVIYRMEGII